MDISLKQFMGTDERLNLSTEAIRYDLSYRMFGMRRLSHFINPRVMDGAQFEFPINSELHYFKPTEEKSYITKELSFLQNNKVIVCRTITDYKEPPHSKNYRVLPLIANNLIREATEKEGQIIFLKPTMVNYPMTDKKLLVYNYGMVNSHYKYYVHKMNPYYFFQNNFHTLINNVVERLSGDNTRHIFINIDVPPTVPQRIVLDKFTKHFTINALKHFPDYRYYLLLEFWKLLNPKELKNTAWSKINKEDYSRINILFVYNANIAFLNLNKLISLVKDYAVAEDLQQFNPLLVRKLFYLFINKLIITPVTKMTEEELNSAMSNAINGNHISKVADDEEEDIQSIEKEIDNYDLDTEDEEISDIVEETEEPVAVSEPEIDSEVDEENIDYLVSTIEASKESTLEVESDTTIEEIKNTVIPYDTIADNVDAYVKSGKITKAQRKSILSTLEKQNNSNEPYGTNEKLSTVLDDNKDDYSITPDTVAIAPNEIVFDNSSNRDIVGEINRKYLTKQYKKDMVRTIYSFQRNDLIINDYVIDKKESFLGNTDEHKITFKALDGRTSTVKMVLPTIDPDGTFTSGGQKYKMRLQRADLPIRKISRREVVLSSNYGKIFIDKAMMKKDDAGYALVRYLTNKDGVTDLTLAENNIMDLDTPAEYALFSRYIKGFKYKDYTFSFDYERRYRLSGLFTPSYIKELEDGGVIVVGIDKKSRPIVINKDSVLFIKDGKNFTEIGTFTSILELHDVDLPIEYASIKIFKKRFPIGLLLSYYLGFESLVKLLKVQFHVVEPNSRTSLTTDQYVIQFKDKKLIMTRDHGLGDMVLYGIASLNPLLKTVAYDTYRNREMYNVVFASLGIPVTYTVEIDLQDKLFVDPITLTLLKEMKEPVNFQGLLLRAGELLIDDDYENPSDIKQMALKGYERIAGMVYKEMVYAIKTYETQSKFSKAKITVNPYSVFQKMREDSTTVLMDDLNPMAMLKQQEDVTFLGEGGRSKDGMSRDTRIMNSTEIGVISEASKDSSEVGVSAYLTASPAISNIRGIISDSDPEKDGWSRLVSTSAMLSPFGLTDDVKRLNFASIMNSHIIPIEGSRVPYVLTGYEAIIPVRADDKFAVTALEEGVVTNVTKKHIEVKYKTQGTMKYSLSDWNSKEESGTSYRHIMVPNLQTGDKFQKDDTIVYDSKFFEPLVFNPKRVVYKQGIICRMAFQEVDETDEDSTGISKHMDKRMVTKVTKSKSVVISKHDNIFNAKKTGDKVMVNDPLFTFTDGNLAIKHVDARTAAILAEQRNSSPKTSYTGIITKITLLHNCPFEELSPTLKELAVDKSGLVDLTYRIDGQAMPPDSVELKYYIEMEDGMGIGDKAIYGNQLKCTVGKVYEYDLTTEDNEPIDATFSAKAVYARVVNSTYIVGTAGTVLKHIARNAVDIYFNK